MIIVVNANVKANIFKNKLRPDSNKLNLRKNFQKIFSGVKLKKIQSKISNFKFQKTKSKVVHFYTFFINYILCNWG